MQIDLSKILEQEGAEIDQTWPLEASQVHFEPETYDITEKSDIQVKMVHTGKRKAKISAAMSMTLKMTCDRCLMPVNVSLNLQPEIEVDYEHPEDGLDELPYVKGYMLDLDGFIMDETYVSLPMKVLCREDCKGLCMKCGKNLNKGECGCDTFVPDPRMARILEIYNANKEEV